VALSGSDRYHTAMTLPSDAERVVQRVAPLTFGVFGSRWPDGQHMTRSGGSGVFIAPFLGLTALHVIKDLLRLDDRETIPRYPFVTQHAAALYQLLDPLIVGGRIALWHVNRSWVAGGSDLVLLQACAESDDALTAQYKMPVAFLEWQLLPPEEGEYVYAIGFPSSTVQPDGEGVGISAQLSVQRLRVGSAYVNGRDRGMLNFPCFEVSGTFRPGFSGGPVICGGRLCGLATSGSTFDDRSYVALLWPLCTMEWDNEFGTNTTFGELLDRRIIAATDWRAVKPRISKVKDDDGRTAVRINEAP